MSFPVSFDCLYGLMFLVHIKRQGAPGLLGHMHTPPLTFDYAPVRLHGAQVVRVVHNSRN